VSIREAILYFTGIGVRLSQLPGDQAINEDEFWLLTKNGDFLGEGLSAIFNQMKESIAGLGNQSLTVLTRYSLILCLVGIVISVVIRHFLSYQLANQRTIVFNAFKSLGKSSISQIVQKLNDQSGRHVDEANTSPLNPQEEGALRKLSTPIDEDEAFVTSNEADISSAFFVLFLIAAIACLIVFHMGIRSTFATVKAVSPFYSQYIQTHNRFTVAFLFALRAMLVNTKLPGLVYEDDIKKCLQLSMVHLNETRSQMGQLLFGDWRATIGQLTSLREAVTARVTKSAVDLSRVWNSSNSRSLLADMSYESSFSLILQELSDLVDSLMMDSTSVSIGDDAVSMVVLWLVDLSWRQRIDPILSDVTSAFDKAVEKELTQVLIIPIVICACIMVICGLALLPKFISDGEVVHWLLRSLLFCDPRIVMDSKPLFKILSNDFSGASTHDTEESTKFYEKMIGASADSTFFLDNAIQIRAMNRRACEFLGVPNEQALGKPLFEVLQGPCENLASVRSFSAAVESAMLGLRSPCIESDLEVACVGGSGHVRAILIAINGKGEVQQEVALSDSITLFTLTLRDLRAGLIARESLKREQAKLQELLSLLLPKRVLARRQRGEDLMAFTVQNASFLYLEIEAFHTWCCSQDPVNVVPTIQGLFDTFDKIVEKHSEMIVLRALDGSYIAVGGAFAEGAQPQVHAKQAIDAGLEMISALESFNLANRSHVKVRILITASEHIVAGVLELDIPTFQIFGAPYTEARQLIRASAPMKVIITQTIYEHIFSAQFLLREGFRVDTGRHIVNTYVVQGYDERPNTTARMT
jgi:class 3 adenylate cyclase